MADDLRQIAAGLSCGHDFMVDAIYSALREAQAEQRQADVTKLKEAAKNQGGAFQCCALALLNMAEAIEAGGHK